MVDAGATGCVQCVLFGTCVLGTAVLPHVLLQASAAFYSHAQV